MDPNANLREQRSIVTQINAINDASADDGTLSRDQTESLCVHASRLAELVEALDGWILHGGFLPDGWQLAQKGTP